jgi:3-hydroxyisobutyrate dehydrogenase
MQGARMTKPLTLAFLGLGVMGAPMAGHLARAGHKVRGWNRTASRGKAWRERFSGEELPVELAPTASQAVAGADVVLSCLGNDHDLAEVMLGEDGALAAMHPGALYIDAPVSGGQAGAENGKLSIMCGGSDEAMARAVPVMQAYAARIVHIGPPGAGQGAKAINQVCIAGVLAGLSEGVRLAQAGGLDMDKVLEAISGGAAQSWQMENRWTTMAAGEFDFGFAIDWMRKDLAIALAEAKERGVSLPVTALVDQFYAQVQAAGGSRQDTSALIRHLPEAPKE